MSQDVTILIDSDIVAYKSAAIHQVEYQWDENTKSIFVDEDLAKEHIEDTIDGYADKLNATRIIVCLTDKTNFRKSVLPSYKANRKDLEKPILLDSLKEHLKETYESYIRPSLEADDVMGILSTSKKIISGKKIIISEDKDMETIPGYLFNPRKDKKPRYITEEDADIKFFTQVLTGDTVDGYKGCKGIGAVKAKKIIAMAIRDWVSESDDETFEARNKYIWESIVEAYEKAGQTEEDALIQARMARILRANDYDFQKKEVVLWKPTWD